MEQLHKLFPLGEWEHSVDAHVYHVPHMASRQAWEPGLHSEASDGVAGSLRSIRSSVNVFVAKQRCAAGANRSQSEGNIPRSTQSSH